VLNHLIPFSTFSPFV